MDIPVSNHENNAYEAARQAERELERQCNLNINRGIHGVRLALDYIEHNNAPNTAASVLRCALNSLEAELKTRGERNPIDGD